MKYNIFDNIRKANSKKKNTNKFSNLVFSAIFFSCVVCTYIFNKYPGLVLRDINLKKLTLEDVENKIMSSENLTDDEKEYLCNEEYIKDILPYINKKMSSRLFFNNHLDNISIQSYDSSDLKYEKSSGYYTRVSPQIIHIRNYKGDINYCKDTVSHEFVHMCQMPLNINILKEACAEIISHEYFEDTCIDAYKNEVILVKTLMEIIGPEPVWYYNFTGDFSEIEKSVKPYLNDKDYKKFKNIIAYSDEVGKNGMVDLEISDILDKLYKAKYNENIEKNEIIDSIKHNKQMSRYYFNENHINEEESYYINRELFTLSTKEAYDKGYINFYVSFSKLIPPSKISDFLNDGLFEGCIEGYKDEKFTFLTSNSVLENPHLYNIYIVKGYKKVSLEEFYENNKSLDENSDYFYTSPYGYIKSIDLDGNIEIYLYIKKSIPTIEDIFDKEDKKILKKF